jgi:hypothetical protein
VGLAALNQGIKGWVIANPRFSKLAPGDLEIKEREITTIQMPNQIAGAEDNRSPTLNHPSPETAVAPTARL